MRDIVIVPTDARFTNLPEWDTHPPAGWDNGPVALGDGITIECLSGEDAEAVISASTPSGENFEATRSFSQLYAFVREVGDAEHEQSHWNWDTTHALTYTLALSRLVLDNACCTEFAARVIDNPEGRRIAPLPSLDQRLAYRLHQTRFWLTEAEAAELAVLRSAFNRNDGLLPDRVRRASWRCGRSAETPFIGEAVMNVVTGLEALLKTERHNVTRQFTTRVPALAVALGVPGVAATDWEAVYEARSDVSHGAEVSLFAPPGNTTGGAPPVAAVALVAAAQDVLRAAVRRAIEDADFRARFADDAAVRAAWPI